MRANYLAGVKPVSLIESFSRSLNQIIVLVSSLFEGLVGTIAVTSIKHFSTDIIYVGILYDLIPLIHFKNRYLNNPLVKGFGPVEKAQYLRRKLIMVSASLSLPDKRLSSSRLPSEKRCKIFHQRGQLLSRTIRYLLIAQKSLRIKYGLTRKFCDVYRRFIIAKDIEGLIRAFARLETQT